MKHLKKYSLALILSILFIGGPNLFADMSDKKAERRVKNFLKFDEDGDKHLNLEEYTGMIKDWFEQKGKSGYEEVAKKRFKRNDKDGDKLISYKEQTGEDLPAKYK